LSWINKIIESEITAWKLLPILKES
jgi:hypothetical protein